jgi:hypothetical protein
VSLETKIDNGILQVRAAKTGSWYAAAMVGSHEGVERMGPGRYRVLYSRGGVRFYRIAEVSGSIVTFSGELRNAR